MTYSVYKLEDGEINLKGSYPKRVNAEGARVKLLFGGPGTDVPAVWFGAVVGPQDDKKRWLFGFDDGDIRL